MYPQRLRKLGRRTSQSPKPPHRHLSGDLGLGRAPQPGEPLWSSEASPSPHPGPQVACRLDMQIAAGHSDELNPVKLPAIHFPNSLFNRRLSSVLKYLHLCQIWRGVRRCSESFQLKPLWADSCFGKALNPSALNAPVRVSEEPLGLGAQGPRGAPWSQGCRGPGEPLGLGGALGPWSHVRQQKPPLTQARRSEAEVKVPRAMLPLQAPGSSFLPLPAPGDPRPSGHVAFAASLPLSSCGSSPVCLCFGLL